MRSGDFYLNICGVLMTLLALFGCAGGGASLQNLEPGSSQTTTVVRLEEGRTGFVISENATYSDPLRYRFERGVAALEKGDYDAAIRTFKAVSKKAPLLASPYINLAIAYVRSGNDAGAEEPLKKVLDLVAGHPLASHEYGLLLRRAGRFSEALTVYETSLRYYPEYFPLRKNLGVLCDLYLNDTDCAYTQYEKFLEAQPDDEQVKLWLVELKGRR